MKKSLFLLALIISLLVISCQTDNPKQESMSLIDAENISTKNLSSTNAELSIIEVDGTKRISVKSKNSHQASVIVRSSKEQPWDLTEKHQVKAEVSNVGAHKMQVAMYVGLDPDPLMRWYCSNFVDLKPGESKTVSVDLTWLPWILDPPLDLKKMRGIPGKVKTDRDAIQQVSFSIRYPTAPSHYTVNSLYAVGTVEVRDTAGFLPFVDEFGQYKHDDWQGKIHTIDELIANAKNEQAELEKYPKRPGTNKYGGWGDGPKQEATGYFYPKKVDGKWWLVDPSGALFWTAGVNCVSNRSTYTSITGREQYFESVPSLDNDHEGFYMARRDRKTGKTGYKAFNFYSYNLYRLFGEDYLDKYRDLTHQRFASWGLNTIGFVSDKELAAKQKTPYVGSVWIRGTRKIEGSEGYQGKFHDVFDNEFQSIVRKSVEAQKFGANDPWCIGYFVDNEMSWGAAGSLSIATLVSPADQPAKIEFLNDLKANYKTIDELNKVWGTEHKSWKALLENSTPPDESLAKEDLDAFYDRIARKYFKTVHDELERVAPHQNYLGCRLAWAQNDITLRAAADYCDIISFNKYEFSVEDVSLPEGVDHPIMIGEFHFGSLDRGMFHVGVKGVEDQEARGRCYQEYIQSALRNPLIVGAHWFQYVDEPITGRGDGENYNVGLVDVCNTAYPELTGKIRETCYDMYNYRSK